MQLKYFLRSIIYAKGSSSIWHQKNDYFSFIEVLLRVFRYSFLGSKQSDTIQLQKKIYECKPLQICGDTHLQSRKLHQVKYHILKKMSQQIIKNTFSVFKKQFNTTAHVLQGVKAQMLTKISKHIGNLAHFLVITSEMS